jgi:hypothetical protein
MKTFELMGSYQSISDADGNILIEYELLVIRGDLCVEILFCDEQYKTDDDVIAAVTENIKVLLR